MKVNTALGLMLSSIALWFYRKEPEESSPLELKWGFYIAVFVCLLGIFNGLQYLLGLNFGIDEFFIKDFPSSESLVHPGRMSPFACIFFILLSASLLAQNSKKRIHCEARVFFLTPLFIFSMLSLIGYIYSETTFYQLGPYIRISWQSALSFNILAIGILFSRPLKSPVNFLTSTGLGGATARRLLPVVIFVPLILGFLWLEGRRAAVFDRELGVSLFVLSVIIIFMIVIYLTSQSLDSLEVAGTKALSESEAKFRTIANAMPQMVWSTLPDGFHDYYNKRWYEFTGVPDGSTDGEAWNGMFHPDDQERAWALWRHSLSTGEPYEIEYRLRHHTGEYRWTLGRALPIRNNQGEITRWMGTCTDIHNQKTLVDQLSEAKLAAEKANEAKTHFLANVSHEIRTPIGAITGFAEMLNHPGYSDSERMNYSMIIERNSKQLLRLVDDILDLSKVEAGKIVFEDSDFNLNEFLMDFEAVMSLKAVEKGIQFNLKVDGLIPENVKGDQVRLKQILSNLVGNAIKFTIKGEVSASISYQSGVLKAAITDTGIGIAKENISNLFKPFSQADPSLTRKFGGTGLGLVLSKRLANEFGGDLFIEKTEVGVGSTFVMTACLPIASKSEMLTYRSIPAADAQVAFSAGDAGSLKDVTVLLVEDSPDNRMLVSLYLAKTGVKLLTANDGFDGLMLATKSLPDIVLMDIQMPRMDGHEATRKLREAGFTRPIIALTAHALREERERCLLSGFSDYMTKPMKRELLINMIRENVANYRAQAAT